LLLVILGAGASYDSLEPLEGKYTVDRPPLAGELFDDRDIFSAVALRYPATLGLLPWLRRQGRDGTIEAAFDSLQKDAAEHPERVSQLTALRFYIRDAITNICAQWVGGNRVGQLNHHALLEQLEFARAGSRVLLVTFNYDNLLETAMGWMGRSFMSLDSYVDDPAYQLFKLHGSADWSRQVRISGELVLIAEAKGDLGEGSLIEHASKWKETENFVRGQTTFERGLHYVPAIAVPVQTKFDYQCPPRHLTALRNELSSVTRILTIGWRGQEQHFLSLLSDHVKKPVSLFCVSGEKARSEETVQHLRNARLLVRGAVAAEMGFSELVSTRAALQFMESRRDD
jgi:hypothetical protein